MQTLEIKLPSIDVIKQFVAAANSIDSDIDLGTGRIIVDAKSILGVLSYASNKKDKILLTVHTEDSTALNCLQPFMA